MRMSRKKALEDLLAKVEAGEWMGEYESTRKCGLVNNCYGLNKKGDAWCAYKGSLDAAKALHDAVLPHEGWEIYRTGMYPGMIPGSCPDPYQAMIGWGTRVGAHNADPARAWLCAILKALIAQETKP